MIKTEISSGMVLANTMYVPLVSLFVYLGISLEQVGILAALLAIDYLTGILKAFRIDDGLKSYKALSGLFTKGSILFLVMSLALMGKGLQIDMANYLSIFISALIISETYSIFGNIGSAVSGKAMAEFDAVSMIIAKVRKMIERIFFGVNDRL